MHTTPRPPVLFAPNRPPQVDAAARREHAVQAVRRAQLDLHIFDHITVQLFQLDFFFKAEQMGQTTKG